MIYRTQINIFIVIFFSGLSFNVNADGFGRLFTSLEQRQQLESLRQQEIQEEEIQLVDEITSFATEVIEKVEEIIEPTPTVELKGVIYRKNGKRVAWINDSNTLSGDMEGEDINVKNRDIRANSIRMIPKDGEKPVVVRVGERFDGETKQVEDNMDDILIKRVK